MTLLLVVSAVALSVTGLSLRVHRFGRRPVARVRREAIVVLGARVLPDGTPSEALAARVAQAVALYRDGLGARLVFSGAGTGALPEALVASRLAVAAGVKESDCLLESDSQSTFTNAQRSVEVLRREGLRDVWLVTDDFHAYRAVSHFRRAGLEVVAAPVTRALAPTSRATWTLREVVALLRRPWLLH